MRIPLKEFEMHISETILSRGLTYYRNGFVIEPEELNPGEYEFILRGRDDYTVHVTLSNDVINEYVCLAPVRIIILQNGFGFAFQNRL